MSPIYLDNNDDANPCKWFARFFMTFCYKIISLSSHAEPCTIQVTG